MRLKKELVGHIAGKLARSLLENDFIIYDGPVEELVRDLSRLIVDDLSVEDRLNDEVKEIIRSHHELMDKTDADFGRIFQMVKSKLVKERGFIL